MTRDKNKRNQVLSYDHDGHSMQLGFPPNNLDLMTLLPNSAKSSILPLFRWLTSTASFKAKQRLWTRLGCPVV
jgi:hypothetical protein